MRYMPRVGVWGLSVCGRERCARGCGLGVLMRKFGFGGREVEEWIEEGFCWKLWREWGDGWETFVINCGLIED